MLNPYSEWLNLPSEGERPDHYMLLGLPLFEQDRSVIKQAIERQVAAVGQHVATNKELAQRLLREIEEARQCLMDHSRKAAYDAQLQASLGGAPAAVGANPSAAAPVAALPSGPAPVARPAVAATPVDDDDDEELPVANLAQDLLPPGATPDLSQQVPAQTAAPANRQAPVAVAQSAHQQASAIPQVQVADSQQRRAGVPMALILVAAAVVLLLLVGVGLFVAGVGPFANDDVVADSTNGGTNANPEGNNPSADANAANDPPLENADPPPQTQSGNADDDPDAAGTNNGQPTSGNGSPNSGSPELDSATLEAIAGNLTAARQALGEREFTLADEKISAAAALDPAGQQQEQIQATTTLAAHVGNFWATVRNSVKGLKPADQIELAGVPIGIIEVDDRGLTIKRDGQNERHDFEAMPSQFAYALAMRAFPENSSAGKLALAAFLIVDPDGNPDRVAEMLTQVANDEADTAAMLQAELDRVLLAMADRPMPSANNTEDSPENPPSGGGPVIGVKVAVPDDAQISAVIITLKSEYEDQIQQAQEPGQHLQLMETLVTAAKTDEDPIRRYGLLQLATEHASEAQDASAMLGQIDLMGDFFEIDLIDVKSTYLARAARWAVDLREPVAQAALDLADDAILLDRYPQAVALARTAQTAARGLGNAKLLQNATERAVAFGQLARDERNR